MTTPTEKAMTTLRAEVSRLRKANHQLSVERQRYYSRMVKAEEQAERWGMRYDDAVAAQKACCDRLIALLEAKP